MKRTTDCHKWRSFVYEQQREYLKMGDPLEGQDSAVRSSDEAKLLLNIFPEEVWCLILGEVKEASHCQNISNASPLFRTLLLPRAPELLFPEVVKLMPLEDKDELPQWIETRGVCRAWKQGMDQILQTQHYFVQDENQRLIDVDGFYWEPRYLNSMRLAEFSAFEAHFDPTHLASGANPFLHKKIDLCFVEDELEDYYVACVRLLQKYGRHVWFCDLGYDTEYEDVLTEFYNRMLPAILELMPNLRALYMDTVDVDAILYTFPEDVAVAPFPALPHLEFICVHQSPDPIVAELLRKNPQVKYVDALRSNNANRSLFLELLPQLRELSLTLLYDSHVQDLYNAQFNSQVARLWLDLSDLHGGATSEQVFRALERHFSESLVELHLRLPHSEDVGPETRLVLPRLKILYVEMVTPQRLDFLLPLKDTLEELHLALDDEPEFGANYMFEVLMPGQGENDKLQVYTFWSQPQNSNIWASFSKLGALEMKLFRSPELPKKCSCSRKDWQAEREAQGIQ